jgi:hypothetical protein
LSQVLRIPAAILLAALFASLYLVVVGFLAFTLPPVAMCVHALGFWAIPLASHLFWHGDTPERSELAVELIGTTVLLFIGLSVHFIRTLMWGDAIKDPPNNSNSDT